jgi:Zn-dependent protease with chaperone function
MELVALGLLVLGVVLAEPVSRSLALARWPERDPVSALLLWQAIGLAGGLALLGAGLIYGFAPLGSPLPAMAITGRAVAAGRLPAGLGVPQVVALLLTVALMARLLSVLAAVTLRTLRVRARHRDLLDLLGTPWPAVPGARVLDHSVPVAYCLPGRRSRLVVSAGVLDCLDVGQVSAVLAHERTHLRERHDLDEAQIYQIVDGLLDMVGVKAMRDLLPASGIQPDTGNLGYYGSILFSVFLIGWGCAFLWGPIADRFGRTRALMGSVLVYSVFTAACGFSQTLWQFAVFRAILGLGMGGEWASGAALVSETWSAKHRGRAFAFMQSHDEETRARRRRMAVNVGFAGSVAACLAVVIYTLVR